ncbi:hypothetical protein WMP95_11335, partial [Corynebacterium marquesiae]
MVEQLLPDLPDETIPILMRIVEEQLENKCGRDQAYELLGKLQKVSEPTSFEEFLGRLKRKFYDCPERGCPILCVRRLGLQVVRESVGVRHS